MANIRVSNPLQNLIIAILNYSMVAIFAVTCAYWIWVFIKPSPLATISTTTINAQDIVVSIKAASWFSNENRPVASSISSIPNLKLVGVFSSKSDRHGSAIFQLDNGKQQYAQINQEIVPGLKLIAVTHNSASVDQSGIVSEIKLIESAPIASINHRASGIAPQTSNNDISNPGQSGTDQLLVKPLDAQQESKPFNIQELIQKSNLGKH